MLRRRFSRNLLCATAFGITAASMATPASAQQVERIVAFGDSYTDDGNAFQLGYANPQALSLYSTGRFSGGSNYIDTLSQFLGVPVENFAIGGAFGGTNNGTLCFDAVYGAPLCGRGLQYEIDQFLNVGTQSTVFPNASTTLTRNDLLAVSIGGNDSRIYQQGGGTLAGASAAGTAAAAGTAVQLNRLVALGDPTISFLALNGAVAPEVATQPAAQAIRGAFSTAYYTSLQSTLAGYAAGGSIVHYLDGQLLLQNVVADPAAFGLTSAAPCPAAQSTNCVTNSSFSNQYLFYVDGLHLTSAGFAIVAKYVAAQLDAPLSLQAPSDASLDTARQFGRTLSTRVDLHGPRAAGSNGMRFFLIGDTFQRDVDASDDNNAFDIDGVGVTAGVEVGLSGGVAGIAANYTQPRVRFGDDSSRVDSGSYQIGAYAGFGAAGLFAQGHLGHGLDYHDIRRSGVVDNMRARPDGSHTTAGLKGGYLMPMGMLRIGPVAAVDYARAKVDGYSEDGDAALTLNVGRQTAKSLTGQIGVEARGGLDAGAAAFRPFISATLEHQFEDGDRNITFAQTSAPGIVNTWNISGGSETYGRISGGASANILGGTSLDAAFSTTIGRDGGNDLGAHLGLRMGF